ncbi:MFS transporter [Virgibacillus phasianinus]|uniref:MFS transporter n=1 Tax=Virgibacillus phasianinus TaxID=2017483 RepID=A0A220U2I5_9BACI|nr:MFS transporter [Virgibacillus phasianinus]ASK61983.1 MFS transporter [Virgibacillus phasianinus]
MINQTNQSQKWAITLFTIGVFMAGLDNGIISTALTTINDSFNVSPSWGTWSITLYTLGIAVSVPIVGKLSDRYGRKRLFIIEITLFAIGSLLVALSPTFTFLLIARVIQSIGGGGIFIIGSSHILATLPKEKQGRALGLLGGMNGIAAVIGPNLGAVILDITGSWHWLFLINLPIALFLIIGGVIKIDESYPGESNKLDFTGSVLLAGAILSLMLGITRLDSQSFKESLLQIDVLPYIILGFALFIILLVHEKRVEARGGDPILAFSLLEKKLFQLTLLLGLLSGGFLAGIIFIPAYVQQVLQVPVENAGYWLTPLALASGIGAGLGGYLTDKRSAAQTVIISGVIGIIGFFMFPLWVSGVWTFIIASVLAGIGLGILLGAPLNVLVGESAKSGEQGSALGTLSLIRQIGLTLFPTIYAGYITGSLTNIKPTIVEKFGAGIINFDSQSELNYGDIQTKINQVHDDMLVEKLETSVTAVMETGFNHLFITAGILSVFVVAAGLFVAKYSKN